MYQNIMLKGLSLFNKCTHYFSCAKQYVYHTYECAKQYIWNYDYSLWIFLSGHSLPLPASVISNRVAYNWKYNTYSNQLIYSTTNPLEKYVLSVLSAKLLIKKTEHGETKEYDLDPFLEKFCVLSDSQHPPNLKMILMCWCAYHKIWFSTNESVSMEYIDHLGNFITIHIKEDTTLFVQKNKLYITH
jgi:hypothetical protein